MQKKIKILSIIETLGRGGAERVLVNTLPELKKLGIECEVAILFEDDTLAKELEVHNIQVHRLNLSHKWNILEGIKKLNKLAVNNQYDIIHAHLFFAHFYTGLVKIFNPKIKIITTFHNLEFKVYPPNTFLKKIRKYINCFIVRKMFDKVTAVSKAVQEHYQEHCKINKIDLIHNSFPLSDFENYKKEKKANILKKYIQIKDNRFIVLTPGRLTKEKGHKYLIETMHLINQKYPNFLFLFIGKGPLENTLKENAPNNLQFISAIEHSELMKIYKEVDLIVIPSIYEAFGLVIGEAMIMGKPIVATDIDGIVEMITTETEGLLVPPKKSEFLFNAIERLYLSSSLQNFLVQNAEEKIKQFDTKVIAKQWKQYYEDILHDIN